MKKVIIFAVCLMFFLSPAYAKKNKENSREIEPQVEKEKSIKKILKDWVDVKIITPEKEIIKKYYIYNQKNGKKDKKKALPPGLKKKLARGGNLPPGWQKKSSEVKYLMQRHTDMLYTFLMTLLKDFHRSQKVLHL